MVFQVAERLFFREEAFCISCFRPESCFRQHTFPPRQLGRICEDHRHIRYNRPFRIEAFAHYSPFKPSIRVVRVKPFEHHNWSLIATVVRVTRSVEVWLQRR